MDRATDAVLIPVEASLDVTAIHAKHADFIWASLQRLGVHDADLEDLFQEVFVVIHARLSGYEGRSQLPTWLFGICMRVAWAHRRRARFRHERPADAAVAEATAAQDRNPEEAAVHRQGSARLQS